MVHSWPFRVPLRRAKKKGNGNKKHVPKGFILRILIKQEEAGESQAK